MTTNPLLNAPDGPTVICGIVIYGIEYIKGIKGKLDKLVEWKKMNPGVTFVIMTIRLFDEKEEDFVHHIKSLQDLKDDKGNVVFGTKNDDGVINVIDIPFIEWLIKYTHSLRLPVHYISDILRWYCLDILVEKKTADYACVMEADLICLKDDWIIDYIKSKTESLTGSPITNSPIKDKISIFGSDRTFIMHNGNTEILKEIILSFNDIYQYFIQTNLYSSNFIYFINQIKSGKTENGKEHYYKTQYDIAICKINKNNKFEKEQIFFITSIPLSSQMGINIRQKYNFNLTSSANDDPQIDSYKHENLANWLFPTDANNNSDCETEAYNSDKETEEKSKCTPSPTKKQKPNGGGKKTKKNKRKNKRKTLKYKRKTLKRG